MRASQLSRSQWLSHIEQWRLSGLSREAYCRQHDLKSHTLTYWINKYKVPEEKSTASLTLVPAKLSTPTSPAANGLLLRCPNGSTLSLPVTVSPTWLAQVLRQLT
jgi:transposase-like protein